MVVVTILVLIFGEIIPKSYAITYSKKMAKIYSSPIKVIMKILSPVSFIFYQIIIQNAETNANYGAGFNLQRA